MAPSGNLELGVTINGKRAVAEAKVQGEAAGAAYQSGFNNAFDEGLSKIGSDVFADLRKRGAFEGDYVGDAFASKFRSRLTSAADDIANAFSFKGGLDDFAKDFDNVDEAAVHLRQSLTLLNDEGKIGESAFRRYGGSLNNWLGSARKTEVESDRVRAGMDDIGHALDREVVNFERVAQAFDLHNKKGTEVERVTRRLEPALKSAGNGFNGFHSNLLSLSNNFGQVVAIIGLILSSLPELAILSSAAAGGILVLADALGALVLGAGVFAVGLVGLLGDIKNVPVWGAP
jgi:hypothetical protein